MTCMEGRSVTCPKVNMWMYLKLINWQKFTEIFMFEPHRLVRKFSIIQNDTKQMFIICILVNCKEMHCKTDMVVLCGVFKTFLNIYKA